MARPRSRAGISTTAQRELTWYLAQGDSKEVAARKAGFADTRRLTGFTRSKQFADELRTAIRDHMSTNLAPKAIKILNEIMSDKDVHPKVRVDAAKALLDRSGYSATAATKADPGEVELEGMSVEQLETLVSDLSAIRDQELRRRAEDAKLITVDSDAAFSDAMG